MERKKSTFERGKFKKEIHSALYKSADIRELLLGDTSGMSTVQTMEAFKKHVKSHLFIDDTITEAASFIFYDIVMPDLRAQTKHCQVIMYLICHRSILDDYEKEGYVGNRADILSQMVEDALINDEDVVNKFGIGELQLADVGFYNATRFYGCIMTFEVPSFR